MDEKAAPAPGAAAESPPYDSLAALRNAHAQLRQALAEQTTGASDTLQTMRAFLARAQRTGAMLADATERRAAQGILDYWSAEIASSPGAAGPDFMPALLAPADPELARAGDLSTPSDAKADQRSREVIRLAATARLWRDSGRKRGFLLLGDALAFATRLRDTDPDIATLVDESEKAIRRKRRNNVLFSVVPIVLIVAAYIWGVPALCRYELAYLTTPSETKQASLWRLGVFQRLVPPSKSFFDLTGTKFGNIDLPGLKLVAVNFSNSELKRVNFERGEFPNSSFAESPNIEASRFESANLTYSQFQQAVIKTTSFANAQLYRAAFDEAQLCDVDFSGADLRKASFRSVTLDDKSAQQLHNAAWWLAVGWNSAQLQQLLSTAAEPLAVARSKFLLKQSKIFEAEFNEAKSFVASAGAGAPERAVALNQLAWTLATWGLDIDRPANQPPSSATCLTAKDVPGNARDAAEQAVCIAEALNKTEDLRGKLDIDLANFRDTLGYVLLQANQNAAALDQLEKARVLDTGEVLFRYAVARHAVGHDDAADILAESMERKQYFPSHELQQLRPQIQGGFARKLYALIDSRRPPLRPTVSACAVP